MSRLQPLPFSKGLLDILQHRIGVDQCIERLDRLPKSREFAQAERGFPNRYSSGGGLSVAQPGRSTGDKDAMKEDSYFDYAFTLLFKDAASMTALVRALCYC